MKNNYCDIQDNCEIVNKLKAEVELLRQYKSSKQASYESMQIEWNKAVSQNQDLLKQNEEWQKQVAELKAENEDLKNFHINLVGVKECEIRELLKLKQTLREIKEIVGIGLVDGLQPEEYSDFLKILQAQILQKISECEVQND